MSPSPPSPSPPNYSIHTEGREIVPHLIVVLLAVLPDVVGVAAGVADGDEAAAPGLALHHVQQEAELALLPTGVAAAPPSDEHSDVHPAVPLGAEWYTLVGQDPSRYCALIG